MPAISGPSATNQDCRPCHSGDDDDPEGRGAYEQWRASPYASSQGGLGCVACHLSSSRNGVQCPRLRGETGPASSGTSRVAATLDVAVWEIDGAIEAEVSVSNSGVGHLLPTGTTAAFMLLEVAAIGADGSMLDASAGPRLPVGSGARAGRPGWLFTLTKNGDERLEPFATRRSRYLFTTPTPEDATIVARLELCRPGVEGELQCRMIATGGSR